MAERITALRASELGEQLEASDASAKGLVAALTKPVTAERYLFLLITILLF